MFDDFEYIATNGLIAGYWTGNYELIILANKVIADIEQSEKEKGSLSDGDRINNLLEAGHPLNLVDEEVHYAQVLTSGSSSFRL